LRNHTLHNLWYLLNRTQRRDAVILLFMMTVGTVLETLSIGLVIPVLAAMTQHGSPSRLSMLGSLLKGFKGAGQAEVLAIAMVALVVTYVVKTAYLAYLNWKQAQYVFNLQLHLSHSLYRRYLDQPYTFHLQRNSAQMVRNVVGETNLLSHVVTIPALTLISEGLVLLGIGCLLLYMAPLGAAIVMLTVGICSFAFYRFTRRRSLLWGEARQRHEAMRIQHLQQGLGGVKDVKVLGREAQFLMEFSRHDVAVARTHQKQLTMQNIPRLWLELLGALALAVLVLTMLAENRPIETFVPTLGLFAAAAFRLMPSINKVLMCIQSLRFAQPVTETIRAELLLPEKVQEQPSEPSAPASFGDSLSIVSLSYRYPGATRNALSSVTLSIPRGASVGFIGGSGAGKTTLVDVVLGLLMPTEGSVCVDGVDIHRNLRAWQNQIGYVAQHIYLIDDTLRRNVAFGVAPEDIDEAAVLRAIKAAQLDEFVSQLPEGLDAKVGERGVRLSGGQRQRIGIARALYHDPAVLVLDEATSALDTGSEQRVMEAVRALHGEKTVLIIAHRTSTVQHCDTIIQLSHGSVARCGNPESMLHQDVEREVEAAG
jgi:ATP-binding cassette, subfamily B, bacterial PglK